MNDTAEKIKTINSDELLKKQMKDPEFKKEYNILDEEFTIAREIIKQRLADESEFQSTRPRGA